MDVASILEQFGPALLRGYQTTWEILLLSSVFGTLAGGIFFFIMSIWGRLTFHIGDLIASIIIAVPSLVMLFWFYYPFQDVTGLALSPKTTAILTLSLINMIGCYRIFRDVQGTFPTQYVKIGVVSGLSNFSILWNIVVPLSFRYTFPRWFDLQIVLLQTSVFASLISVDEIFRAAQRINAELYQPVLIYSAMALIFVITVGTLNVIAKLIRERYQIDMSER